MTAGALFLSVDEAAELLGISRDLTYDLVNRGELPASSFGRRKLVPRRAIDLVLEAALDGFDPDRLVSSLAPAGGSSEGLPPAAEELPAVTGPEPVPDHDARPAPVAAP